MNIRLAEEKDYNELALMKWEHCGEDDVDYGEHNLDGVDKEEFINEFDVPERYIPLVLIPIGRKSEMPHKSTRFSRDNTTTWI